MPQPTVVLVHATVHDAFAQDLPGADRWLIVASQRPITLGANTAPTETAAWKNIQGEPSL